MPEDVSIALIGQQFMGRAHSNGWGQAARFFDLPCKPRLHTVAARDPESLAGFAERWGWEHWTSDWASLAGEREIDLVDIGTPNHMHAEQAVRMLEAGKHVACEKPLAGTLEEARAMRDAARVAQGKTFVWFNYRRCPAIGHAYRLVREGRLGAIRHVRAKYLQSWGGSETRHSWRFERQLAGSGAHGDLNAHSVDLARFLTGEEIVEVPGAIAETFVRERPAAQGPGMQSSDVDDCVLFLARFSGGAVGSFEASRVAPGHLNRNTIELNGERGSLRFDFEDMNVLEVFDGRDAPGERGWRRVLCTAADEHPYVKAWWPDAHLLGYEHGFVNMAADILRVLGGQEPELPLPDFEDAYQTQRVLAAALTAAQERRAVALDGPQPYNP